jgi:hypothetical protein
MAMTVHDQASPENLQALVNEERTRRGRIRMLLIMALCAAPVIASYFTFYVIQPKGQAYSELIAPSVDLPSDLPLRDLEDRRIDAASLKGHWLFVAVQGGACDATCDKQLFMQRQLHAMLGKERGRVTKLWLIPDDAPVATAVLQAYKQGGEATVLRVPKPAIEAWLRAAQGHALSEHLYLVDPMGNWMLRTPLQPDPAKVKKDLDRLLKASAAWDHPDR